MQVPQDHEGRLEEEATLEYNYGSNRKDNGSLPRGRGSLYFIFIHDLCFATKVYGEHAIVDIMSYGCFFYRV